MEGVDPRLRNGGVRGSSRETRLELQAAVVRGDDSVGEAGADGEVRPGEAACEEPGGTELAADLLVIGEMQLDASAERVSLPVQGLQRRERERVSREVRFRHRDAASVHAPAV